MHLHLFQIEDCCGSLIETVELEVNDDFNFYAEQYDLLTEAGYRHYQCESCYDSAYRIIDGGPVETSPN